MDQPDLKLFTVRQRQNIEAFTHNMELSRKRAESVMAALTGECGVTAARLAGHGVGQLAPVAPNVTGEGRARNRRVELVRW